MAFKRLTGGAPAADAQPGSRAKKQRRFTTLSAFIIEVLQKHVGAMTLEEIVPVILSYLSVLRKNDGSKYTCSNLSRVVKSALYALPVFQLTSEGWVLNDEEARRYQDCILKSINHRLGRSRTSRFDAGLACKLLTHRANLEGSDALCSLIQSCASIALASEVRQECIGAVLQWVSSDEALLSALGTERTAGLCVMFSLLKGSKAVGPKRMLQYVNSHMWKLSNLSLGMLYLEDKLKNEIDDLRRRDRRNLQ